MSGHTDTDGRRPAHDDPQGRAGHDRPWPVTKASTTVWDRLAAQQPQCGYCALGLSCRNCAMGPCRIDPFGEGPPEGRLRGRRRRHRRAQPRPHHRRRVLVALGPRPGHPRDVSSRSPTVRPPATASPTRRSCARLADELGVATEGRATAGGGRRPRRRAARRLRHAAWHRSRSSDGSPRPAGPSGQALGITPRGIDRENVEMLHRTHMGVDNDYVNTLLHGLRTGLSDGWGGSMIATELSDVMFGTPTAGDVRGEPRCAADGPGQHRHARAQPDALRRDRARRPRTPSCVELARSFGATGINVVGLCCTGNELLMRRGVPMAGNHLMQELVLVTGALEAMVVDYQCIMPSVVDVAKCYHTKIISTADKAKFTGATHVSFDPERGAEIAQQIVRMAVEAYPDRNHERVRIPGEPVQMMGGFSVEAILGALGGTPKPLVDAIAAGTIRGAVAVVGCNNPKLPQDLEHIELTRRLIENDVLVLVTGCAAVANGKAGQMVPGGGRDGRSGTSRGVRVARHPAGAAHGQLRGQQPGHGPRRRARRLPRRGHRPAAAGRCRSRVVLREGRRHRGLRGGLRHHDRARRRSRRSSGAPTWSICWPDGLDDVVGAKFAVEPDPAKAALSIRRHIEAKRRGLGLSFVDPATIGTVADGSGRRPPCRGSSRRRDRELSRGCATPVGAIGLTLRRTAHIAPNSSGARLVVVGQGRGRQVDAERAAGPAARPRRADAWWPSTPTSSGTSAATLGIGPRGRRGTIVPGVRGRGLHRGEDRCPPRRGRRRHAVPQPRHHRPGRPAVASRRPTGCDSW